MTRPTRLDRRCRPSRVAPGRGSGGGGGGGGLQSVIHHWDHDDASTTGSTIYDLVGSADLTITGSMLTPTINGHVAIQRNLGSSLNGIRSAAGSGLNGESVFGVFWVCDLTAAGTTDVFFDLRTNTSGGPILGKHSSGNHVMQGSATVSGEALSKTLQSNYYEFNGNSSRYFRNGVEIQNSMALGTTVAGDLITFMNTVDYGRGSPVPGQIFCEAKLMTGTQQDADVLTEHTAMATKWGI